MVAHGTVSTKHHASRRGEVARPDTHATTRPGNVVSKDLSRRATHVNAHRCFGLSARYVIIQQRVILYSIDPEDAAAITTPRVQTEVRNHHAVDDNFIARGANDDKRLNDTFERGIGKE